MFDKVKPFTFEVDPNYDYILDEKGNTYISLRKIRWGEREDFKLDVRKYYATDEGERMSKGCGLSDEAADELARVLVSTGYGNDKKIAEAVLERPNVAASIYKSIKENNVLEKKLNDIIDSGELDEDSYYNLDEVV